MVTMQCAPISQTTMEEGRETINWFKGELSGWCPQTTRIPLELAASPAGVNYFCLVNKVIIIHGGLEHLTFRNKLFRLKADETLDYTILWPPRTCPICGNVCSSFT